MKYSVKHTTCYEYPNDVVIGYNLVHLRPRPIKGQTCESFHLDVSPEPTQVTSRTDFFGNHCSQFNVEQRHRRLTIAANSVVDVERTFPPLSGTPAWESVVAQIEAANAAEELDVIQYVCPSPEVVEFEGLLSYAQTSFPPQRPVLEAALDLTQRIYDDFQYDPAATSISTEIREAFEKRSGVCQDFAHFQIGCLRALGIPACYVSGYIRTIPLDGQPVLVGSDASHAWLSVWCGREVGWVDLDPTNNQIVANDHITVAIGRDFGDVSPVKGVIVGSSAQILAVSVSVEPIDR